MDGLLISYFGAWVQGRGPKFAMLVVCLVILFSYHFHICVDAWSEGLVHAVTFAIFVESFGEAQEASKSVDT